MGGIDGERVGITEFALLGESDGDSVGVSVR